MLKALVGSRHTKQMYACAVLHAHIHLHLVGNVKQISPQEIDVVPFFLFCRWKCSISDACTFASNAITRDTLLRNHAKLTQLLRTLTAYLLRVILKQLASFFSLLLIDASKHYCQC